MTSTGDTALDPTALAMPSRLGSGFGLALLTAIMTVNLVDRQIIGVLAEPIKADLGLTDTQLGLLTGTVFSIFYSVIGLPIAALADRTNRARLIAIACFGWSLMTAVSALANNFVQLALARIGVAAGEAGCVPTTLSLVADYCPPERRATGVGIIWLSAPFAMIGALVFGGPMAAAFGWRLTLAAVAVPGILLAILAWIALPEPRAKIARSTESFASADRAALLRNRSFLLLLAASGTGAISTYAVGVWMPAFFQRIHGWSLAEMGVRLGLGMAVGSAIGALFAAMLADRFATKRDTGHLFVPIILQLASAPLLLAALFTPNAFAAVAIVAVWQIVNSGSGPGVMATFQAIAPGRSRATAFALVTLAGNLIGLGVGPALVGALSDALVPRFGTESLRYALLLTVVASLASLAFMLAAGAALRRNHHAIAPAAS